MQAVRAIGPQGQHHGRLGILFLHPRHNGLRVRLASESSPFDFIEQKPAHALQRVIRQRCVYRRGIENDTQALISGLAHHQGGIVQLILHDDGIAGAETLQHVVNIRFGGAHVFPSKDDNAVLPPGIHLDHRMGAGTCGPAYAGGIHFGGMQSVQQHAAVLPHDARMAHLPARFGNGNGLVQPLPAAEHAAARSQYGFTWPGHMLDGIDVVNVHGTIVENLHLTRHLSFVCRSVCLHHTILNKGVSIPTIRRRKKRQVHASRPPPSR